MDNHGADLILNVHFGKAYANAFWDGDEMTFGDGDGEVFINLANALDVTAHELTHGVVQYTAGLTYQGQSGAVNEHFADVFGSVIKQVVKNKPQPPPTGSLATRLWGQNCGSRRCAR